MTNLRTRLEKMERRMGVTQGPVCRVVMSGYKRPVLPEERCIEIVKEAGYWPRNEGPFSIIMLMNVPPGLNAEQTELFLREHGDVVFAGGEDPIRAKEKFASKYGLVLNQDDGFDRSPVIDTGAIRRSDGQVCKPIAADIST